MKLIKMLQTYASAERKEINQIITIYQSILKFSLEEVGLTITIKHAKEDVDNLLDDVNSKLIEICDGFLKENNVGLDKYQLATIVMNLYTKTITSLSQPFYVQAKEDKNKVKEYVKANKDYMKKVKEVKEKNKNLQEEVKKLEKESQNLNNKLLNKTQSVTVPQENPQAVPQIVWEPAIQPLTTSKPKETKKSYNHDTNTLATEFIF